MITSSPGFQRVTPSPTFQTIPEASEPPMWWSNSGWELNTDTGWPSAAQTLLKFTPAAITRTVTSNAPGSGVSISSSWKASSGSPASSLLTGQSMGVAGCYRRRSEPVAALEPEQPAEPDGEEHQAADAEDEEVGLGLDVVDQ